MISTLLLLRTISSLKTEAKVVGITLLGILLLPVIAVVVTAGSGLSALSNALAAINPVTHMVEVRDPRGKIIAQLQTTTTWPLRGGITTEFGAPDPPYQVHHTGIDIAGKVGDPISSFMTGTVIKVDTNPGNSTGYGKYVIVSHGDNITSLYGHMSQTNVLVGQSVKPGDALGLVGDTGHALGAHLHFEIRVYGIPVDPRIFMVGESTP